jgi:tetratricopeptide (TPR) repeat protein
VVYLRMTDADRIMMKSRWWLYHDGEGLRWWDGEDLQLGLRISTTMAAGIASATSPGASQALERFIEVLTRLVDLPMDDPVQVQAFATDLDGLSLDGLPASFRHLAITARASAAVALDEPEDALRRLDALEIESLQPLDMPVRHFLRASANLALERWPEAAEAIEKYLALLGEDAEAYHILGLAKLGSGDSQAAMAAFDQGLADDPRLPDNYGGAAMVADDVAAVVERLAKAPEDAVVDGAAQWLVDAEDGEGLERLIDAAAQARPGWNARSWTGKAAALRALEATP